MLRSETRSNARTMMVVALGIGVAGEIVLDGPAPGFNVLLMTVLVLGAGWALRRRGRAPDPLDAWLPISAVALAAGIALRADPFVGLLDLAGAAAFGGASVAAFSGLAVTRRSLSVVMVIGVCVFGSTVAGAIQLLDAARPAPRARPRTAPAWLGAVVRGLVLAIPLVVILAVLFVPDDAIPAIVAALPRLPVADAQRMRALLVERRQELSSDPAYASPFGWNLGRERAREALAALP